MKMLPKSISNKLLIICSVAFIFSIQACTDLPTVGSNFLEKPPSAGVNKDSIFTNADYAKRFLWETYNSLPYGPYYGESRFDRSMLASLTDISQNYMTVGSAYGSYYSGSYNASSAGGATNKYRYDSPWNGIRDAYIFLENIGRTPAIDGDTKARLKAEAQMIIALHYVDLFRNYGGVPWVDHAYGPNEDFQLPRITAKATLDSIVTLIDRAIPNLPFELNQPSTESGRFTQAGAMGLKCRVLLFGASPLFNSAEPYLQGEAASKKLVWYGEYDPGLWQRAADACGTLIDKVEQTGAYYLLDTGNPRQDFQDAYYDRDSPGMLISVRERYKTPGGYPSGYYYNALIVQGAGTVTDNYVKMFPMKSGKPIDDPASNYDPQHPYENRDPRLYETVLVNGDKYQGRTAETYIGGRERKTKQGRGIRTGYRIRKFILDIESALGTVAHWPELRLAEIYLSYAEALNEVNGGPTQEAYKYVNKVRERVGLDGLPSGLSQEEFRQAVLRERVLELGFEEVRLWDMIRWKRKDIFQKTLYGMDICKKGAKYQECEGSYGSNTYIYDRFELPTRYWQDNWSNKWYLSAFPLNEILKDYGLIQNPGWEL